MLRLYLTLGWMKKHRCGYSNPTDVSIFILLLDRQRIKYNTNYFQIGKIEKFIGESSGSLVTINLVYGLDKESNDVIISYPPIEKIDTTLSSLLPNIASSGTHSLVCYHHRHVCFITKNLNKTPYVVSHSMISHLNSKIDRSFTKLNEKERKSKPVYSACYLQKNVHIHISKFKVIKPARQQFTL